MSSQDLRNIISATRSWFDSFIENVAKIGQEEWEAEVPKLFAEFYPIPIDEAKKAYKRAIDKFYESYNPIFYSGERRGSLYEIFTADTNAEGGIDSILSGGSATFSFDDSNYDVDKMGAPRPDGGSTKQYMYDLVFVNGYHGGAPDEFGIYRYRKPYKSYKRWGAPASQSTPPKVLADKEINTALHSTFIQSEFQRIVNKHGEETGKRVLRRLGEIGGDYF